MRKILHSPFTLHQALIDKIERETRNAEAGRPARIIVKVNSLIEAQTIQALYRASMAGVDIHLVVRGTCRLRPGVPGVSERIQVRSVVGRFLEHTRVYYFENDGDAEVYCASADWMERNFFQRVEVCFPIAAKGLRKRVIRELEYYLTDNTQAWVLQSDGSYQRCAPDDDTVQAAQMQLLETLAERS